MALLTAEMEDMVMVMNMEAVITVMMITMEVTNLNDTVVNAMASVITAKAVMMDAVTMEVVTVAVMMMEKVTVAGMIPLEMQEAMIMLNMMIVDRWKTCNESRGNDG